MNRAGWSVAVLGATGAVGRAILRCLERTSIRVAEIRLLASPRSAGETLEFDGSRHRVEPVSISAFESCDLALFSAGSDASAKWGPIARDAGAWVVDNSSRFRMDPDVPLIVPEVNAQRIPSQRSLIANPNCSTIQLVVALKPILDRFGIARLFFTSYQAASGVGQKGVQALKREEEDGQAEGPDPDDASSGTVFPHPLHRNVVPQCDQFLEDGYTREEEKVILETRKILETPDLPIHPTCVRVPVETSHSEAIYLETVELAELTEVRRALETFPGLRLFDDPQSSGYPTPRQVEGTEPVWVGRIRRDRCEPRGLHLWIVADNLLKGAALNAVQIAEAIWERELPEPG